VTELNTTRLYIHITALSSSSFTDKVVTSNHAINSQDSRHARLSKTNIQVPVAAKMALWFSAPNERVFVIHFYNIILCVHFSTVIMFFWCSTRCGKK